MAERKKRRSKRDSISVESIKKLIKQGAKTSIDENKNVRVSKKASLVLRDTSETLIKELAEACRLFLIKNNRKTTRDDTILYVIEHGKKNWGVNISTVQSISLRNKQSSLSRTGIVRVFKTSTGKDFRVSQKAKRCLVSVVEAYILNIGKSAGRFADSANRSTIKTKDISNSLDSLIYP